MHSDAREWIRGCRGNIKIAEIGSLNVNGSVRDLFPDCDYTGIDILPGPGVDLVQDGKTWDGSARKYDIVICCEVLEHEEDWPALISTAFRILKPGGYFWVTCANKKRKPHDWMGNDLPEDSSEYYGGVSGAMLSKSLVKAGFTNVHTDENGEDTRGSCQKPWKGM